VKPLITFSITFLGRNQAQQQRRFAETIPSKFLTEYESKYSLHVGTWVRDCLCVVPFSFRHIYSAIWQPWLYRTSSPTQKHRCQIIWIGCWFVCSDTGSVNVNVHHLSVNMQVIIRCVQMSNSTRVKTNNLFMIDIDRLEQDCAEP
jgi:hypothetical protein